MNVLCGFALLRLCQPAGEALAAVFAVLTGMVGAVSAKYLLNALRIASPAVRSSALGTAPHGLGAVRALQVGLAALLTPPAFRLLF